MPDAPPPTANNDNDPLSILEVFDRLEVGPVKVEKRRLVAPYRVFYGDKEEQTELIYTYEEDVFDPGRPESRNLADMIAAQVALNYGLFCREIVFKGLFDKTDRQFLKEMAENTAREIFVKKFLEPNPFLVGDAARLPAVKPKAYLRARLTFPVTVRTDHLPPWKNDPSRHCILSSGGKDSLLSFGLLDDMGREVQSHFRQRIGPSLVYGSKRLSPLQGQHPQYRTGLGQCRPAIPLDASPDAFHQKKISPASDRTNTPSACGRWRYFFSASCRFCTSEASGA